MAFLWANELHGVMTGEINDKMIKTRHREWIAHTKQKLDDASIAEDYARNNIADIHDIYQTALTVDQGIQAIAIRSRQLENPYLWIFAIDYSSDLNLQQNVEENPLARPAVVNYSFETVNEAFYQQVEVDGTFDTDVPVVNSAKEPFVPPFARERGRLVITIEKNEALFNKTQAAQYMYTTNENAWFGFAAKTCLITDIKGDPKNEQGLNFYRLRYVVKHEPATWYLRVLDQGKRRIATLAGGGTTYVAIIDSFGRPPQNPVLLDGAGGVLASGADPVFREFRRYAELDWAPLGIP